MDRLRASSVTVAVAAVSAAVAGCGCGRPLSNIADGSGGAAGAGPGSGSGSGGGGGGAGDTGPSLVVAIGDEVLYVSADGASVRSVYRFARPDIVASALVNGSVAVRVHGGWTIATRSVTAFDRVAGWQQGDRAVLLDSSGSASWEKAFTTAELGPSHRRAFTGVVGDGGQGVLVVGFQHLFVTAEGAEQAIEGVIGAHPPFTVATAGTVVPVIMHGSSASSSRLGWWRPAQPIDSLPHEMEIPLHVSPTEPRIIFGSADTGAGERVLVDARPSGFETRPWPSGGEGSPSVASFGSYPWWGDDHGGEIVRWNVRDGTASRLTWALPAGMRRLSGPSLGGDGALLVALRNDHMAGVYRSASAGPDWTLVGETLGAVESVLVREIDGTYAIDTVGTRDRFVPTQSWEPAPAGEEPALSGRSHQLVRPAAGVSVEVVPSLWTVSVSPDGLRALYWEEAPPGHVLVLHDIVGGGKRPLAASPAPASYSAAWAAVPAK